MIEFTVYGKPAPAGSKRGFYRGGRVIITDDSKNSRPWKALVSDAAIEAMNGSSEPGIPLSGGSAREDGRQNTSFQASTPGSLESGSLLRGPLVLEATFYFPRPKGHYGTGRNADVVKPGAPLYPDVKPDIDKLSRAILDSCTGVIWKDDAQVVNKWVRKMYGEPARCEVRVEELAA